MLVTNTSVENKIPPSSKCGTKMATQTQHFQTKPTPLFTDLGTGFTELLDLGYVVGREGRLHVLAHLLHIAGNQDSPAAQQEEARWTPAPIRVLGLLN